MKPITENEPTDTLFRVHRFTQKDPKEPKRNPKGPKRTQKDTKGTQKDPKGDFNVC